MITLYNEIIFKPILNLLVFLYNILGNDIGLAIIAVTIIIRIILYPFLHKSLKAQKSLQDLQPQMDEIREKYKDNKELQMQKLMELYKEKKVNPLSSCLPLIIQFPVIIGIFEVLRKELRGGAIEGLYGFVSNPGTLDTVSFGIVNLAHKSIPLAAIAAGLQFLQTKMMQQKKTSGTGDPRTQMIQKQMLYILPIFTFIIASTFPAGLSLYWAVSTLFAAGQQWFIMKKS